MHLFVRILFAINIDVKIKYVLEDNTLNSTFVFFVKFKQKPYLSKVLKKKKVLQ